MSWQKYTKKVDVSNKAKRDQTKTYTVMKNKATSNKKEKWVGEEGASGNNDEAEHSEEFPKIAAGNKAALRGHGFYLIDADKFNPGKEAMDLHSRLIIPKNCIFIGHFVDTTICFLLMG